MTRVERERSPIPPKGFGRRTRESDSSDELALDAAYLTPSGIVVIADTMYIAGTKSVGDVVDDFRIPLGRVQGSVRFRDADKLMTPQITHIVGHSLGGSVALELQKKYPRLQTRTFGAPVFSRQSSSQRFRHPWDPVSMLDRGATLVGNSSGINPHSHHGFE